jgi:NitT/TauT family transport system ATP-binding protein
MGNAAMSALLEIQGASKTFLHGFDHVTVLNRCSLSVESGELITILGSSGCGKSTLLRCAGGFTALDSGKVLLNGKEVTAPSPAITMVFQMFDQLFPWKTVH